MTTDRRDFLRLSALAGGALGLGLTPGAPQPTRATNTSAAPHPLKILILGGTSFIGPPQVRYALSRGHEVTLFNRGRTNPGLFPGVETLIGDRNGQLDALKGKTWDVVIDNSSSNPEWTRMSAEALVDSVGIYMYVSSRSAYADTSRIPMGSDAPTFTYESAEVEPGAERLPYGLAKAEAERQAQRIFGEDRANIVRPGLIIGPGDPTDRFTYWPVRIHRGGEVLAPGDPTDPIQNIDVRDLCEWMIRMAENGTVGEYNGVGPAISRPWAEMLYGIRAVTTAETTFTWVPYDFLTEMEIRPYSHMPAWMPPIPGREGFARFDLTPEVESGLTFRPLAVTAKDTLDFHFSRPPERQAELRAGVSAEREAEVLAAWHGRDGATR
jgi:2'-hydroxyisoflavone reductase